MAHLNGLAGLMPAGLAECEIWQDAVKKHLERMLSSGMTEAIRKSAESP